MLKKIGQPSIITKKRDEIAEAQKLILPGVGSFDHGMENLEKLRLTEVLNEKVLEEKTPIIGICLGMQLLAKRSDEGNHSGLGWIDAEIIKFKFKDKNSNLKIPHMGWNTIHVTNKSPLFTNMPTKSRFYFVHSYHMICNNPEDVAAETYYGYNFISCVQKNNVFGVQFHPEKSHKFGMTILSNFAGI